MARPTGKNTSVVFGSTNMSADFQSWNVKDSMGLAEVTAGDDAAAVYASTYTKGGASWKGLFDDTSGTVLWAAVANGTEGTLTWGPLGTATGKPKYTVLAMVENREMNHPYADGIEITVDFVFQAAVTPGTF